MRKISQQDLLALSVGASLLGSGGGGNPEALYDLVHYLMQNQKTITLLSIEELNKNDLIVPIALVGAPLISIERIPNMLTFEKIYHKIILDHPKQNIVLMPAEIGGCNALTPLILALQHNLPVLDADLIGRAFPKITMCKPARMRLACRPTYVADHQGNLLSLHLNSVELLEKIVRDITVHFGSCATIATFLHKSNKVKEAVIEGSISRALTLGHALLNHNEVSLNPFLEPIGDGMITDVFHTMQGGFLIGRVVIKNSSTSYEIHFQNEYLKVSKNGLEIEGSPDIIVIIDKKSGLPLSTESLIYGLEVSIALLDAPDFWNNPTNKLLVDYKVLNLEAI